jgi:SAM-dependent methyltransferase
LDDLYLALFGRHIDNAALLHLRPRLHAGTRLHEIAVVLAQSDEYAKRVLEQRDSTESKRIRLERIYTALLGRSLDDSGYEYYQSLLSNGMSLDDVLLLLAESDEHENRVLRKHIAITDLRTVAPERYVEVRPKGGGVAEQLLRIDTPEDFDWLEKRIALHGCYERPGSWSFAPNDEKRIMAEIVAAISGSGASVLELGCANGVLLGALADLGVEGQGVEFSDLALSRASETARPRIHIGDIGDVDLDEEFDGVVALDILEHLNPNRLATYLDRVHRWIRPGGFLIANLPAFGVDPVFGEIFPIRFVEWERDAEAGRLFSLMELEEDGWPKHGHLIWADSDWWQRTFADAGLRRDQEVETAIRARWGERLQKIAPARMALYVLSKPGDGVNRAEVVQRVGSYVSAVERSR